MLVGPGSDLGSWVGKAVVQAPGSPGKPNPYPDGAEGAAPICHPKEQELGGRIFIPASCGHQGFGR